MSNTQESTIHPFILTVCLIVFFAAGSGSSLVDLLGSSPAPSVRMTATADLTERQQIRVVYAPLRLSGSGRPVLPIATAGSTFGPLAIEAIAKFGVGGELLGKQPHILTAAHSFSRVPPCRRGDARRPTSR
jgi:hypothetical protein